MLPVKTCMAMLVLTLSQVLASPIAQALGAREQVSADNIPMPVGVEEVAMIYTSKQLRLIAGLTSIYITLNRNRGILKQCEWDGFEFHVRG
ncbi:hypothetical protein F4679DRAFT_557717 [Xylaria curta]|nr:hypothetical protein F4679DRAFT_557717 [Xylaria curta]